MQPQAFLFTELPEGPISASLRRQIETEVTALVPADKRYALLGVATPAGWRLTGAVRVDKAAHLELFAEADQAWGGPISGRIGVFAAW